MNIIECEYANNPRDIQANLEYFRDFLQKRGSAENTVDSYLTSVRHYHSLYSDVTVENLQAYKGWLMEHYKPNTVNTRIYGINQYVIALQDPLNKENAPGATETYKLPSVKHQQKPFLNNVISKRDYEKLCGEMLSWLALRGTQTGFIFTNRQGKQMSPPGHQQPA